MRLCFAPVELTVCIGLVIPARPGVFVPMKGILRKFHIRYLPMRSINWQRLRHTQLARLLKTP